MVAGSSASETGKLLSHLGVRSFKTSLFFPLDKVCGECQVLHPLKDEIVNALYSSAGRSGVASELRNPESYSRSPHT
jgi:hypothetical protein